MFQTRTLNTLMYFCILYFMSNTVSLVAFRYFQQVTSCKLQFHVSPSRVFYTNEHILRPACLPH